MEKEFNHKVKQKGTKAMSYDISLTNPVTHETLTCETPHFMHGGTYALNGTTELWLNVTCNYSDYYRYEKEDGSKHPFMMT